MHYRELVVSFIKKNWETLFVLIIFLLLLFRNPYSNRTIIANLEPYPDSFHYVNPALSLLQGKGLYITRETGKILPSVPPLYSIALLPGYILNNDVRTFYLTNVVLALIGFYIFHLVLKELFKDSRSIQVFLLFLFATNYLMYWFPELAMAENLLMPFILLVILTLVKPVTNKTAIFLPVLSVALFATKFSSLPLAVAAPVLFLIKILSLKKSEERNSTLKYFIASLFISGLLYVTYDYFVRGSNVIWGLISIIMDVFSPKRVSVAMSGKITHDLISVQYANKNGLSYLGWILGSQMKVLPKQVALLPRFLIFPSLVGLLISLRSNRKFVSVVCLASIFFTIAIMMLFYAADGRYLVIAVPALLIGVGLFLDDIKNSFSPGWEHGWRIFLIFFFLLYCLTQGMRLKSDIMLNLKYSETPWYFLSVETFDDYLAEHKTEYQQTPVIISAMPPYFIDLYAKQHFILLPLSPIQEFASHQKEAWGDYNYDYLPNVYQKYFESGHEVFLTKYGLGDVPYLHSAYDELFKKFTFIKVVDGCYSVCDVYRITGVLK